MCDDHDEDLWIRGWESCLEKHVVHAVRSSSDQLSRVKAAASVAFKQGGKMLDVGRGGPEVMDRIVSSLCRKLSNTTRASVVQNLQAFTVPKGTPFST